jgi:hypothetical protein
MDDVNTLIRSGWIRRILVIFQRGVAMRRIMIASIVSAAITVVFAGRPSPGYANPASVWVANLDVVNASSAAGGCTIPHNCDLTTTADRAALLSSFGTLQTQSGGRVEQEPTGFVGTPPAGFTYVLVQTDGSLTQLRLNGRGLTCTPACDALTTTTPNATDHFVAYKITDTGSHHVGDMLVATAMQDAVTLDSATIVIVGPSVGGIAEQPDVAALPARTSSGGDPMAYTLGGAALALVAVIGAGSWYVRRKRPA